ncbi:MAG: lytic transglycosylase [Burkholderiales bacterium RIFCSPHIGHO2_12_FULL_69_20]|nr:MAG: lytic transglycosylase [Burkholderiales bacterium RIFCSPHIGHO2_12_FULL_69_20]
MDASVFLALALACAPQVHTHTAHALVSVESAFNPWAIGVVGGALVRQPRHRAEALATARALQAAGWNFSVGLGQINVGNFERLGLTLDSAFEPCTNLTAMQSVLAECFDRARAPAATATATMTTTTPPPVDQTALRQALSCYYSGNFATGFRHGYVRKVVAAAGTASLVASRAIPPAQPKEKT